MPSVRRRHVTDLPDIAALPRPSRPTFFFHTHLSLAYGHVARCHKIARETTARLPCDAHIVSSSPEFTTGEDHPGIWEVLLPSLVLESADPHPDEMPVTGFVSPVPGIPVAEFAAHRSRLLAGLIRHLRPLGIHLEGFPFVFPLRAQAECVESLSLLAREFPRTLRCAGFNGVSVERQTRDHHALIRKLLDQHVDLLFVYVDEAERPDVLRACPFLEGLESRVHFVGYVGRRAPAKGNGTGRMLATFGGGFDAYAKIRLVCDAFRIVARHRPAYSLEVVTGGFLPDAGFREIEQCYGDRIRVTRFLPGLASRLGEYELVISMAGYNTCTELYLSSTRSIVLPRTIPGNQEQLVRARRFRAYGAVDHIVDAATATPEALARLMEDTLSAPPAPRIPIATDGGRKITEIIGAELARRRPADG
jgi:predicted glycosyltransferase